MFAKHILIYNVYKLRFRYPTTIENLQQLNILELLAWAILFGEDGSCCGDISMLKLFANSLW